MYNTVASCITTFTAYSYSVLFPPAATGWAESVASWDMEQVEDNWDRPGFEQDKEHSVEVDRD